MSDQSFSRVDVAVAVVGLTLLLAICGAGLWRLYTHPPCYVSDGQVVCPSQR